MSVSRKGHNIAQKWLKKESGKAFSYFTHLRREVDCGKWHIIWCIEGFKVTKAEKKVSAIAGHKVCMNQVAVALPVSHGA